MRNEILEEIVALEKEKKYDKLLLKIKNTQKIAKEDVLKIAMWLLYHKRVGNVSSIIQEDAIEETLLINEYIDIAIARDDSETLAIFLRSKRIDPHNYLEKIVNRLSIGHNRAIPINRLNKEAKEYLLDRSAMLGDEVLLKKLLVDYKLEVTQDVLRLVSLSRNKAALEVILDSIKKSYSKELVEAMYINIVKWENVDALRLFCDYFKIDKSMKNNLAYKVARYHGYIAIRNFLEEDSSIKEWVNDPRSDLSYVP